MAERCVASAVVAGSSPAARSLTVRLPWGRSSNWQSVSFALRRLRVRPPPAPLRGRAGGKPAWLITTRSRVQIPSPLPGGAWCRFLDHAASPRSSIGRAVAFEANGCKFESCRGCLFVLGRQYNLVSTLGCNPTDPRSNKQIEQIEVGPLRDRLMVGRLTLNQEMEVRILLSQYGTIWRNMEGQADRWRRQRF